MLKKQGIDEAAMTVAASQKIYKEEAPVWAGLAGSLGMAPQQGCSQASRSDDQRASG